MATTSKKETREARRRVAQMQAKRQLRAEQGARRRRDNLLAAGAILVAVLLAVVLQLTVFSSNPTAEEVAAAAAGLNSTSAATDPASGEATDAATAAQTNSPNVPAADTAAGKTFTGQLSLNGQPLGIQVDGTKAPQAAAVFKSLADANFFNGLTCHRLTNADNFGVLQCGSKGGDGAGDPDYQWGPVENSPADGKYPAGSIAVARGSSTYSNGTQFFIVYKDTVLPQTDGGYTLMGNVTSGLDVVQRIADAGIAGGASDGAPVTPVTIDSFTLG